MDMSGFSAPRLALVSCLSFSIFLLGATPPVFGQEVSAQNSDEVIEEIVVVGSRLRRRDFTSPSPIATLDRETLAFAIQPTMEESLNRMPQVTPDFDRTSNNPGDGTASVNLRGLGSGRTLVLLNGRRMASSGVGSAVDINNIPHALIDRVEVITGGATTVYGSDAVAGVVNFVTRDDFDGFGIDTSIYTTEMGDSNIFDLNLTYGHNFANGRGNVTLFGGYYDRDSTLAGEREFTAVPYNDFMGEVIPGGSIRNDEGTIVFPQADLGNGPTPISFDADGIPIVFNDPEDRYNFAPSAYLQTPLQRYSGGLFLDFDLNERHETYVELMYSRKKSKQQAAPVPAGGFTETNYDNPILTPEAQQIFEDFYIPVRDTVVRYWLGRRLTEVGDRTTENTREYTRIAAGFRGELGLKWDYDAWITYTSSEEETLLLNDGSLSKFHQGLLVDPATGQCFDPSGGCVPIDIFGAGRISAEAIAFFGLPPLRNTTTRTQKLISAFVRGSPFDIWSGAVDTAFGVEWREDTGSFEADEALATGDTMGYRGDASVNGSESVFEIYGEALFPIIQNARFAEYLGLEIGARYSDYKNAGSVETFKIGGEWRPTESVQFRTMFQRSVRAPNLKEAFLEQFSEFSQFVGFDVTDDPCTASADPIGNGNLEKCVITGLPADQVGIFEAEIFFPTEFIQGGNPDLQPEEADTFTIGVVLNPSSLQNLSISVDYFDLKVEDTIGGLDPLIACFDPANKDGRFCDSLRRNPTTFDVDEVVIISRNRGALHTQGVDTQLVYQADLPDMLGIAGNGAGLGVNIVWTHVIKNSIQELPAGSELTCHGHFGRPCNGNSGHGDGLTFPEDRVSAFVTYDSGDLGVQLAWRWYAGTRNARLLLPEFLGTPVRDVAIMDVGSKNYVDLGISYRFSDKIVARFNVANLLDTDPPFMANAAVANNTDTHMFDIFGRSYSLSLSLRY